MATNPDQFVLDPFNGYTVGLYRTLFASFSRGDPRGGERERISSQLNHPRSASVENGLQDFGMRPRLRSFNGYNNSWPVMVANFSLYCKR